MWQHLSPECLEILYRKARTEDLSKALAGFGEAVTGVFGYLSCNGYVIHSRTDELPVLGGDGTAVESDAVTDCPDVIVNHLGLCLGRVSGQQPDVFRVSLAMLAIRLGLLSRILDMSYTHLKDRVSFGQKTLKHQLVKATFAEVHGVIVHLGEQMRLRADRSFAVGIDDDHLLVSQFTGRAEKLMGGHGYLLDGTHSLSYLSMLLFSVYGLTK